MADNVNQMPTTPSSSSALAPSSSATAGLPPRDYTHYICAPVYTGLFGVGLGSAVGSLRGHSPLLYALHMGIGYGLFGGAFSSSLYGLEAVRQKEDIWNWIGAGSIAGGFTSYITGGPRRMVSGAVLFGGLGMVAEAVCDLVGQSAMDYKHRRAIERIHK